MMRRLLAILALCMPLTGHAQAVTDGSGTVTAGGISQIVLIANVNRSYLMCLNPLSATETLFVNIDGAASTTASSYELAPGGSVTFFSGPVPRGIVSVTAATTGHRFVCKWQ